MGFSTSLKTHEKSTFIFTVFHGNFMKFMIHLKFSSALKNAISRGFFMAFLIGFSCLFHGIKPMKTGGNLAMKSPWKTFENLVNIPWIYSQDFHGFSFRSQSKGQRCRSKNKDRILQLNHPCPESYYVERCWARQGILLRLSHLRKGFAFRCLVSVRIHNQSSWRTVQLIAGFERCKAGCKNFS